MAVNWNDVRLVEGLVACLDDLCEKRKLPRPGRGSCDPEVMQFHFDLAELFDVWDKAQAYGHPDQRKAAWQAVEDHIRQFMPYVEAARREGRKLEPWPSDR